MAILILLRYVALKKRGYKCHFYRKQGFKCGFLKTLDHYNNNITLPFLFKNAIIFNNLMTFMIKKYINFNYSDNKIFNL